jgi:hypothetical protein
VATTITGMRLMRETAGHNDEGVSYTRNYQIDFSGGYDASTLLYATYTDPTVGLGNIGDKPNHYAQHPVDAGAYASDCSLREIDGDGGYGAPTEKGTVEYIVKYSQKKINWDPNPLNRPAIIDMGGSELEEVQLKDLNDAAIVNSSKELYDAIPPRPIRGATEFTITKNEATNPMQRIEDYSNTVNNAIWHGEPIDTVRIGIIKAHKKQEQVNGATIVYWEVTYPFFRRKDGWRLKILDRGWSILQSGIRVKYCDEMGREPTQPILLDGSGGKLAEGSPAVFYPSAGYLQLAEADWTALNLPNPFA